MIYGSNCHCRYTSSYEPSSTSFIPSFFIFPLIRHALARFSAIFVTSSDEQLPHLGFNPRHGNHVVKMDVSLFNAQKEAAKKSVKVGDQPTSITHTSLVHPLTHVHARSRRLASRLTGSNRIQRYAGPDHGDFAEKWYRNS